MKNQQQANIKKVTRRVQIGYIKYYATTEPALTPTSHSTVISMFHVSDPLPHETTSCSCCLPCHHTNHHLSHEWCCPYHQHHHEKCGVSWDWSQKYCMLKQCSRSVCPPHSPHHPQPSQPPTCIQTDNTVNDVHNSTVKQKRSNAINIRPHWATIIQGPLAAWIHEFLQLLHQISPSQTSSKH
jgi:hypothetical protein